jgi:hypothetical protein
VNPVGFARAVSHSMRSEPVSDWCAGYRGALRDLEHLAGSRGILTTSLTALFNELRRDADVIEHAQTNKRTKERFAAAHEEPLPFLEPSPPPVVLTRPTK